MLITILSFLLVTAIIVALVLVKYMHSIYLKKSELQNRLRDIEPKLKEQIHKNKCLESLNIELQERYSVSGKDSNNIQYQINELVTQVEEYKLALEDNSRHIKDVEKEKAKLEKLLETSKVENLTTKISQEKLIELERKIEEYQGKIQSLNQQNISLQQELKNTIKNKQASDIRAEEIYKNLQQSQYNFKDKNRVIQLLEQTNKDLQQQLKKAEDENHNLVTKVKELTNKNNKSQQELGGKHILPFG
jgi:chromosome segregation ATPase